MESGKYEGDDRRKYKTESKGSGLLPASKLNENKPKANRKKTKEISNEFPNFTALTEEERLAFFEILNAARKNVEESKESSDSEPFSNPQDELLDYFNGMFLQGGERKKISPEASPTYSATYTIEEDVREQTLKNSALDLAENFDPDDLFLLDKTFKCDTASLTSLSPCQSVKEKEISPKCAERASLSKKNSSCTEIEAWNEDQANLNNDQKKVVNFYLKSKKPTERKKKDTNKKLGKSHESTPDDDTWSEKTYDLPSKNVEFEKVTDKKKKGEQSIKTDTGFPIMATPKFDSLSAEEKRIFFNVLQEAHENVLQKNPESESGVLPFENIIKSYRMESIPSHNYNTETSIDSQTLRFQREDRGNIKVKVTLTSGDNQRMEKDLDEEKHSRIKSSKVVTIDDSKKPQEVKKEDTDDNSLEFCDDDEKDELMDKEEISKVYNSKKKVVEASAKGTLKGPEEQKKLKGEDCDDDLKDVKGDTKGADKDKRPSTKVADKDKKPTDTKVADKDKKPTDTKVADKDKKPAEINVADKDKRPADTKLTDKDKKPGEISLTDKDKKPADTTALNKDKKSAETLDKDKDKKSAEALDKDKKLAETVDKDKKLADTLDVGKDKKPADTLDVDKDKRPTEIPPPPEPKKSGGKKLKRKISATKEKEVPASEWSSEVEKPPPKKSDKKFFGFSRSKKEDKNKVYQFKATEGEDPPGTDLKPKDSKKDNAKPVESFSLYEIKNKKKSDDKSEGSLTQKSLKTSHENLLEAENLKSKVSVYRNETIEGNQILEKREAKQLKEETQNEIKSVESTMNENCSQNESDSISLDPNTLSEIIQKEEGPVEIFSSKIVVVSREDQHSVATGNNLHESSENRPHHSTKSLSREHDESQEEKYEGKALANKSLREPSFKCGKVVLVDDGVIEKIKQLIHELELNAKGEEDSLGNDYVQLLLEYISYLSRVLCSLVNKREKNLSDEKRIDVMQVQTSVSSPNPQLKTEKRKCKPRDKTKRAEAESFDGPRSVSASSIQDLTRDKKKKLEQKKSSVTSTASEVKSEDDENLWAPMFVKEKILPSTKIRLLQDLLKERAKFVEGSISEFKIVRLPEKDYVPPEKPVLRLNLEDEEEAFVEKGQKFNFFKALVKFCRCGRKETGDENSILENLKGEAVAVDTSEVQAKNPASATINESTMEVLKAAERKKIIQKYWKYN